jgi:hypothetical protein
MRIWEYTHRKFRKNHEYDQMEKIIALSLKYLYFKEPLRLAKGKFFKLLSNIFRACSKYKLNNSVIIDSSCNINLILVVEFIKFF